MPDKTNSKLTGIIGIGIGIGIGLLSAFAYLAYKSQPQYPPQYPVQYPYRYVTYPYSRRRNPYFGFMSNDSNSTFVWEPLSEENITRIRGITNSEPVEFVSEP